MAEVPSKQYFERKAAETGFLTSNLEKVYRIMQILDEIHSLDTEGYLALRGGTAVNLCYQNVPRLSIDIDLVYVKSLDKKAMEQDRKSIRASLDRIFNFLRYAAESKTAYALDQYLLTYRNKAGNIDRVKVEVNYVSCRIPILKVEKQKMVNLFETDQQEVAALAQEELYGSKIKALIERGIARDLFDIYQIAQNMGSIDFRTLKRAAIFYSCLELRSDFRRMIGPTLLSSIDEKTVKRGLKPLLRRDADFPLEESKRTVNDLISKISVLNEEEKEFVEKFYNLNYHPDLLFTSNPALKHHPGAEWRLSILARKSRSSLP